MKAKILIVEVIAGQNIDFLHETLRTIPMQHRLISMNEPP